MTHWTDCHHCGLSLRGKVAARDANGFRCPDRGSCAHRARSVALGEEIDWLRPFGWSAERIAFRLEVTESCVTKRLARTAA